MSRLEAYVEILGAVAAILTGVKWLLTQYFKQQKKIEEARQENHSKDHELVLSKVDSLGSKVDHGFDKFSGLFSSMNVAVSSIDSRLVKVEAVAHEGPGRKLKVVGAKGRSRARTIRSSSTK